MNGCVDAADSGAGNVAGHPGGGEMGARPGLAGLAGRLAAVPGHGASPPVCGACGHKHWGYEPHAGHQWDDTCPYVGTACCPTGGRASAQVDEGGVCAGLAGGCPGCVGLYLAALDLDPQIDDPPWCAACEGVHWPWRPHVSRRLAWGLWNRWSGTPSVTPRRPC